MQAIKIVLENAPETLQIPEDLQQQRIEVIFQPLTETPEGALKRILNTKTDKKLISYNLDINYFCFDREHANER